MPPIRDTYVRNVRWYGPCCMIYDETKGMTPIIPNDRIYNPQACMSFCQSGGTSLREKMLTSKNAQDESNGREQIQRDH